MTGKVPILMEFPTLCSDTCPVFVLDVTRVGATKNSILVRHISTHDGSGGSLPFRGRSALFTCLKEWSYQFLKIGLSPYGKGGKGISLPFYMVLNLVFLLYRLYNENLNLQYQTIKIIIDIPRNK